ncbi:hypothetical protein [Nodularia chucula]|uniref:hypothetical protein n=1 Tax=Nodularia chucula TaxID=3093667 RepID=UPI0039C6ABFD
MNRHHTQGAIDAPIVLVKYGNYQCLHSEEADKIVQEIGNKIYFVFRHFPQTQIYLESQKAAEAPQHKSVQHFFPLLFNLAYLAVCAPRRLRLKRSFRFSDTLKKTKN